MRVYLLNSFIKTLKKILTKQLSFYTINVYGGIAQLVEQTAHIR
ncbi:conserved hypothetical protein [Treponema phagedenis]|uniref:Uncharacterized protein n=1 Tax=Treponema phagedenis TaxID=162 RepID=A0A0B7GRP7_TREPH|nr:conserved hypothetical protein [Treponema phagedenis]